VDFYDFYNLVFKQPHAQIIENHRQAQMDKILKNEQERVENLCFQDANHWDIIKQLLDIDLATDAYKFFDRDNDGIVTFDEFSTTI